MARIQTTFLFNFFFFMCFMLFSIFPINNFILVHSLHQKQHFDVLNVASSIHKTLQIFSKTSPQIRYPNRPLIPTTVTPTNSSVLSLSLHPHVSIVKPRHQNYSALTLSRLASDSARVSSIHSKLQLAIPKPVLKDLQAPITSGESQGTFEYLARVGFGRPVKEFYMTIDTGSNINWLQCQPCDSCYKQSDPIFDPPGQPVLILYHAPRSSVILLVSTGVVVTRVGSVDNVAVGCGHDNEGLFYGSAGLIGLGAGDLSFPSQIKATSFSYCLVDMDSHSSSTLEFNSVPPSDSIIVPMVHNPKFDAFFYVDLVGISVAGQQLSIQPSIFQVQPDGSGGVIVDSGTVVTRLVTQAYNSLRDTFVKYATNLPSTSGYSLFDTCFDLSSVPDDVKVPAVSFHFSGGKTLPLNSRNCLFPVDSRGKFCFAFAPSESVSIIGNIQQQETRVSYDLTSKLIGFSPNKC
ncbi:hypothetical protein ACH5RR_024987 [Cinchona calisaya]|uniref:Peptidase A1 domain-containing protein n=1 Tax=Cinchona calisaya TaxID=153742 RepID=A0ABD2YYC1_9GENT